jgi:ElaB/YqjD/DUF883 family membrane-anchored ribosome-binding protein
MTHNLPTEVLEERAAEQRRRLHNTVSEMRSTVREKMNVRRNAENYSREYFPQTAAAVGAVGLVLGWALGGIFDRR